MPNRGEPGEVAVEGRDVAAVLQRDCRENGIGHQVADRVGLLAAASQQLQMPLTGRERQVVWLGAGGGDEREGITEGAGYLEDPAVRGEAKEGRSHSGGHREVVLARKQLVEPGADRPVVRVVLAMRRQHDVDVEQDHCQRRGSSSRPSSRASSSARLELRSKPGRGPVPSRNTGTSGRSPALSADASSRRSELSTN